MGTAKEVEASSRGRHDIGIRERSAVAAQTDEGETNAGPEPTNSVSIQLNAMKEGDNSCALTFLVVNGFAEPIDKVVYETVLFDGDGQVDRLTLFDFGTLPPGRPRVRQFSVGGMTCANLGQILINGSHTDMRSCSP